MNMKWIRIVSVLVACCCMLCLMACDSSRQSEDPSSQGSQTASSGNPASSIMAGSAPGASSTTQQVDAKDAQVVFTAGQVSAKVGETVNIPVTVSKNSKVAAADIYVSFDSTKVTYDKYKNGKTFSPDVKLGNLEAEGRFHYTMATLSPFEKEGEVFTVSFKVAEGVTGTVPITLEVPTLVNEKSEKLTYAVVNGSITVE